MAKTTKAILALMQTQQELLKHVDEMLASAHVPEENKSVWARGKSSDYWEGFAEGINTMLERALLDAGCYAGFGYQRRELTVLPDGTNYRDKCGPTHAEFKEWRRIYFTK